MPPAAPRQSPAFTRFAADGALVLGGGAAILLQLADPAVARGVDEHSVFATDPVGRLNRTLGYVYAVSLDGDELARLAAARVDAAHHGVPGARDAEHQLWVAATLYWTAVRVHRMLRGPLPPALADEVLARFGALGEALQLPAGDWPASRAAFDAYWRSALARAEVGDAARRVAGQLLRPAAGPWWLRAGMPLGRLVTAGLLPASVREAYRMPWSPARAARSRLAMAAIRALHRVTPRVLRELPARRLLAGLERDHARLAARGSAR